MNRAQRRRLGLPASPPADSRIVYGARCVWWDSIANAATKPGGLPCCPHCGGVLMEVPTEAFVTWLRGRCYPTLHAAREAHAADGATP